MSLVIKSPCKVNLLLNILGRRGDGFHEIETLMQPVPMHDELRLERGAAGIRLTCSDARLAVDETNLAHRAAAAFLQETPQLQGLDQRFDVMLVAPWRAPHHIIDTWREWNSAAQ